MSQELWFVDVDVDLHPSNIERSLEVPGQQKVGRLRSAGRQRRRCRRSRGRVECRVGGLARICLRTKSKAALRAAALARARVRRCPGQHLQVGPPITVKDLPVSSSEPSLITTITLCEASTARRRATLSAIVTPSLGAGTGRPQATLPRVRAMVPSRQIAVARLNSTIVQGVAMGSLRMTRSRYEPDPVPSPHVLTPRPSPQMGPGRAGGLRRSPRPRSSCGVCLSGWCLVWRRARGVRRCSEHIGLAGQSAPAGTSLDPSASSLDSAAGSAVTVMGSGTAALEEAPRTGFPAEAGEPGRRPHQAAAHRGRRRTADLRPARPPRSPTVARSTSSTVYRSGLNAVAAARMSRCGDQSHGSAAQRHGDARCEALGALKPGASGRAEGGEHRACADVDIHCARQRRVAAVAAGKLVRCSCRVR